MINRTFNSIADMLNFIDTQPLGTQGLNHSSSLTGSYDFTRTNSLNEAYDLLKHGWDHGTQALNSTLSNFATVTRTTPTYDIAGHTPSVPRYLQGIPTNMISSRRTQRPSPTLNIVKSISYSSATRPEDIIEENAMLLSHIKDLESKGTRVNLYVALCARWTQNDDVFIKVKVKSASQRLNVRQVAFPLCHPSMLRRIFFAVLEHEPGLKSDSAGYGVPRSLPENTDKSTIYMKAFNFLQKRA